MERFIPFIVIGAVILLFVLIHTLSPSIRKAFESSDAMAESLSRGLGYEVVEGDFQSKHCYALREHEGCRIHYEHRMVTGYRAASSRYLFYARGPGAEDAPFRLVDASGEVLEEGSTALPGGASQRHAALRAPAELRAPALRERFRLYSERPDEAEGRVERAGLARRLERFTYVDLRVADGLAVYVDRDGREMVERFGGREAYAEASIQPEAAETMRAYHEDVAALLCAVVQTGP